MLLEHSKLTPTTQHALNYHRSSVQTVKLGFSIEGFKIKIDLKLQSKPRQVKKKTYTAIYDI